MYQQDAQKSTNSNQNTHQGALKKLTASLNGPPPRCVPLLLTGIRMIVSLKLLKNKSDAGILSLWDRGLHGAAIEACSVRPTDSVTHRAPYRARVNSDA